MKYKFHGKGFRRDNANGGEFFVPLLGPAGEWVADVRATPHAEAMLLALNSHEALVTACQEVSRSAALSLCDQTEEEQGFAEISRRTIDRVRAALALAQPQECRQ
jgi:hypothetical protein